MLPTRGYGIGCQLATFGYGSFAGGVVKKFFMRKIHLLPARHIEFIRGGPKSCK